MFTQITQNKLTNPECSFCKIGVVDITPILDQLNCHLFCMHFLSSPFAYSAATSHLTHGVRMGSKLFRRTQVILKQCFQNKSETLYISLSLYVYILSISVCMYRRPLNANGPCTFDPKDLSQGRFCVIRVYRCGCVCVCVFFYVCECQQEKESFQFLLVLQ